MADKKSIDLSVLKKLEDLDETGESLKEFIDIFFKTAPERIKELKKCVKSGNAIEVSHEAHNLKSACGYMGASAMQALCLKLEKNNAKAIWDENAATLELVEEEFKKAKVELTAKLKTLGGKK